MKKLSMFVFKDYVAIGEEGMPKYFLPKVSGNEKELFDIVQSICQQYNKETSELDIRQTFKTRTLREHFQRV